MPMTWACHQWAASCSARSWRWVEPNDMQIWFDAFSSVSRPSRNVIVSPLGHHAAPSAPAHAGSPGRMIHWIFSALGTPSSHPGRPDAGAGEVAEVAAVASVEAVVAGEAAGAVVG